LELGDEKESINPLIWTGMSLGLIVGTYFVIKKLAQRRRAADLYLRPEDLSSPDLSHEELASRHLADLNAAGQTQLEELGLDVESVDRLIENRPYRNKVELLSRMIVPQEVYVAIKDKIGVANAREPFKVA
jgi:hypothetical protein